MNIIMTLFVFAGLVGSSQAVAAECPTDLVGFEPVTLNRNEGLDFFYLQETDNCVSTLNALKGANGKMQCTLDMDRGMERAAGLGIFMPNYYGIRLKSLCISVKNVDRVLVVPGYFVLGMDGPNVEHTVEKNNQWTEICMDPFPGQEYVIGRFIWIHFFVDNPDATKRVKVRDLEMEACVRDMYFYTSTDCAYYDTYGVCYICFSYSFEELGESIYEHGCYNTDYFYYNK